MAELLSVQVHVPITKGEDGKLLEKKSKGQGSLIPRLKKVDNSCQNRASNFSYLPKRRKVDIEFKGLTYSVSEGRSRSIKNIWDCNSDDCKNCGYKTTKDTHEKYVTIHEQSIQDGVDSWGHPEMLNDFNCRNCDAQGHVQRMAIVRAYPEYLLLHVIGAQLTTIEDDIKFEAEDYELCSFIQYIAAKDAQSTNHYMAYKKINGKWIQYDDHFTKVVKKPQRIRVNMALYRRTATTTAQTVPQSNIQYIREGSNKVSQPKKNQDEANTKEQGKQSEERDKRPNQHIFFSSDPQSEEDSDTHPKRVKISNKKEQQQQKVTIQSPIPTDDDNQAKEADASKDKRKKVKKNKSKKHGRRHSKRKSRKRNREQSTRSRDSSSSRETSKRKKAKHVSSDEDESQSLTGHDVPLDKNKTQINTRRRRAVTADKSNKRKKGKDTSDEDADDTDKEDDGNDRRGTHAVSADKNNNDADDTDELGNYVQFTSTDDETQKGTSQKEKDTSDEDGDDSDKEDDGNDTADEKTDSEKEKQTSEKDDNDSDNEEDGKDTAQENTDSGEEKHTSDEDGDDSEKEDDGNYTPEENTDSGEEKHTSDEDGDDTENEDDGNDTAEEKRDSDGEKETSDEDGDDSDKEHDGNDSDESQDKSASNSEESEGSGDEHDDNIPRKYTYYKRKSQSKTGKWLGRKAKKNLHISHRTRFQDPMELEGHQDFRGYCVLCSKRGKKPAFHSSYEYVMKAHYKRVHVSRLAEIKHIKVLFCKCSARAKIGKDGARRNGHYHCIFCHRPSIGLITFAHHMLYRHPNKISMKDVEHLEPPKGGKHGVGNNPNPGPKRKARKRSKR